MAFADRTTAAGMGFADRAAAAGEGFSNRTAAAQTHFTDRPPPDAAGALNPSRVDNVSRLEMRSDILVMVPFAWKRVKSVS